MTTGAIVLGFLLTAGGAVAQTAGPTVEPPARGIIPVTGPSTVPALSEAAKPELVQEKMTSADARKGTAGRKAVSTTTRPAPRSAKALKTPQRPVAKTAVKKPSAATHAAQAASPQKTKHVTATVKHQPPARHATVGKPIPLSKHQPPAKGAAPAQPVLPRV